jgi:hypothetical protein
MNIRKLIASNVAILLAVGLTAQAAEATKYFSRANSKMRLEGTSNIHDWQMESSLIGGFIEVGENFPTEPGQAVKPGKVDIKAEPFVVVRSLKSLKKDGTPYNDAMDNIMYDKMKSQENPKVIFKLKDFVLKTVPTAKDAPYEFEATGDILAAGETKTVTMPVKVLPMADKKLKISGTANVKMSDFKIEPPSPNIPGGAMIKTADEVKIIFDWMLGQKTAAAK